MRLSPSRAALAPAPPGRPARWFGSGTRPPAGWILSAALLLALIVPLVADESLVPPPDVLREQARDLDPDAAARMRGWADLLERPPASTQARLRAVNDYFNKLAFIGDEWLWETADYWATPGEFLTRGGGDCEDFALAKYFTLVALGIPEERLQLTYVKALELGQAHMVLTYYSRPGVVPLVLDNLEAQILPATQRTDLRPVYSFNGTGLWLASQRGAGERVGSAMRLSRWRDLLARLAGSARVVPPALASAAPPPREPAERALPTPPALDAGRITACPGGNPGAPRSAALRCPEEDS